MGVQQSMEKVHWVDDKDRVGCVGCGEKFTLARRRHHCRLCGDVFCGECCEVGEGVRHCGGCTYKVRAQLRHRISPLVLPLSTPGKQFSRLSLDQTTVADTSPSFSDDYQPSWNTSFTNLSPDWLLADSDEH